MESYRQVIEKKDAENLGKNLTEGALQTLGKYVIIVIILVVLYSVAARHFRWDYNDTDNMANGHRSQVALRTDYGTGCQYLESSDGFLTPRMNSSGKQICTAPTGQPS